MALDKLKALHQQLDSFPVGRPGYRPLRCLLADTHTTLHQLHPFHPVNSEPVSLIVEVIETVNDRLTDAALYHVGVNEKAAGRLAHYRSKVVQEAMDLVMEWWMAAGAEQQFKMVQGNLGSSE